MDEFFNSPINTAADLAPKLVASFGLRLSACPFRDPCPTDHKLTILVFNNITAIRAQLPLFSITFPVVACPWKTDPLFSYTFPYRSFTF
jgi:hypothetical protein